MERSEALLELGLDASARPEQIDAAYSACLKELRTKMASAQDNRQRELVSSRIARLEVAYSILVQPEVTTGRRLSDTMMRDLPVADPLASRGWGEGADQYPGAAQGGGPPRYGLRARQVLLDRYTILSPLGMGGMGAVYAAHDGMRGEDIAIKVMQPGLLNDENSRRRFVREATVSSNLSHPNIVNVYDIQQDGELSFLTMELLKGKSLRQAMDERFRHSGRFSVPEVLAIADAACQALEYAHKVTVHRDIKPENIFLCEDGTVKIMDFGIASTMLISKLTQSGMSLGTAYYMAPEQLRGTKSVDARADVFSLGVVLYELLTGDIPAGRISSVREARSDVPASLSRAIDKALAPRAADRCPDITQLRRMLGLTSRQLALRKLRPLLFVGAVLIIGMLVWQWPHLRIFALAYFPSALERTLDVPGGQDPDSLKLARELMPDGHHFRVFRYSEAEELDQLADRLHEAAADTDRNELARILTAYTDSEKLRLGQLKGNELAEARELAQDLTQEVPQCHSAQLMLGLLHLYAGEYPDASSHLSSCQTLAPRWAYPYWALGQVYFRQGEEKYGDAEKQFNQAEFLDRTWAAPLIGLGQLYLAEGDLGQAKTKLDSAVAMDTKNPMAHKLLGDLFDVQGEYAKAERAYDAAAKEDDEWAELEYNHGYTFIELAQAASDADRNELLESARSEFEAAGMHDSNLPAAHYGMSLYFQLKGDKVSEKRELEQTLKMDRNLWQANFHYAKLLNDEENIDGALAFYQKACELNPSSWGAHFGAASLLDYQGKPDKAKEYVNKALPLAVGEKELKATRALLESLEDR